VETSQRKWTWVVVALHSALALAVLAILHLGWGTSTGADDAVLILMLAVDFPVSIVLFLFAVAQIDAVPTYFNRVICTSLIIFLLGGLQWYWIARVGWRFFNAKHNPPACKQCGYNLTGNVSGVCPECGTVT